MGEPVADKRWSDARKKQLRDSRVVGTRALVDALRDLPKRPRLLISASGVSYYGDRGDELLTESAAPGTGFLAELGATGRPRRCGPPTSGCASSCCATARAVEEVRHPAQDPDAVSHGPGRAVGGGGQWLPWIHLEDHIGLVRHAMSHEAVSGPLNCVAPEPVTTRGVRARPGRGAGAARRCSKAPLFALRLRYTSQFVDEVLLASQRVMPVRTLETGYAFRHPLLRGALAEVVDKRPRDETAAAATTT